MRKKIAFLLIGIIAAFSVAACGDNFNNQRGRGDAPVAAKDDSAAEIINMPDLFMNLATKCNHGNRIYAHTRDAAPVVVPNDPSCAGPQQ
jgi:hypothetical protein